jgi:NAD(P)-dependent dehydrogenase (short-subunit alcohol dehydrogenase family)
VDIIQPDVSHAGGISETHICDPGSAIAKKLLDQPQNFWIFPLPGNPPTPAKPNTPLTSMHKAHSLCLRSTLITCFFALTASIAEVAAVFAFLASEEAANITATDIRCDGGYAVQGQQPTN